jgi:hypothetical protein
MVSTKENPSLTKLLTNNKEGGAVMRLFVDKKAKIVNENTCDKIRLDLQKWASRNGLLSPIAEQVLTNPGRILSLLGVDVYRHAYDEVNILNRGVAIIQENLHDVLEDGFVR